MGWFVMNAIAKLRQIKILRYAIFVKINLFIKVHVLINSEGLTEHRFLFVVFAEIILKTLLSIVRNLVQALILMMDLAQIVALNKILIIDSELLIVELLCLEFLQESSITKHLWLLNILGMMRVFL